MKKYLIMLSMLIFGGYVVINPSKENAILFKQKDIIHKVGNGSNVNIEDNVIKIVTNINYQKTPVFWDTILYPQTGTYLWQYCEKKETSIGNSNWHTGKGTCVGYPSVIESIIKKILNRPPP